MAAGAGLVKTQQDFSFWFVTLTSPEASSTMRCCAASSGRAWSCITSNLALLSTLAARGTQAV